MNIIQLIGRPLFIQGGEPIAALRTHFFVSLLGSVLLAPGRRIDRLALASQLWPASDEFTRRGSLRQLLYRLRTEWIDCPAHLEIDNEQVLWRSEIEWPVDVDRVNQLIRLPITEHTLVEVIEHVRGPLLEGHDGRWTVPIRRAFEQSTARYLRQGMRWAEGKHELALEIRCAEALIRLNPTAEAGWLDLARIYTREEAWESLREAAARYEASVQAAGGAIRPEVAKSFETLSPGSVARSTRHDAPTGRIQEWSVLQELWQSTRQGRTSVALVSGPVGIGKTHLVEQMRRQVQRQNATSLLVRCNELGRQLPYRLLYRLLAQLPSEQLSSEQSETIANLDRAGRSPETATVPSPASALPPCPNPSAIRQLLRTTLLKHKPLLIVVEDIHWCDRESLELLSVSLLEVELDSILFVFTINGMSPAAHSDWLQRLLGAMLGESRACSIPFGPLHGNAIREIAVGSSDVTLSDEQFKLVCGHVEGNPLILLTRLKKAGYLSQRLSSGLMDYSKRVHYVLTNAPREALNLAILASNLGSTFRYDELLSAGDNSDDVFKSLKALVRYELLEFKDDQTLHWRGKACRRAVRSLGGPVWSQRWHRRLFPHSNRAPGSEHAATTAPTSHSPTKHSI